MFKKDPFLLILTILLIIFVIWKPSILREVPLFIEYNTLIVLSTFMLITKGIEFSGYLNQVTDKFINRVKTEKGIAFSLIFIELLISPFITNDVSLFLIIPITLSISKRIDLDIEKLIIFEIWAANIGSSLFPIGNPQNIYIYQSFSMSFFDFVWKMVPFEIINATLLIIVIYFSFKKTEIKIKPFVPIVKNRILFIVSIFLFFTSIFLINYKFQIWALIITGITYLIINKRIIYYGINLNLLLIFVFLFILIGGVKEIRVIDGMLSSIRNIFISSILLSQVISNVPTALLFSHYTTSYTQLLYGVNVAGNGTMISSLANLIGIRLGIVSIKRFHLYSIPFLGISTLLLYLYIYYI